MKTYRLNFHTQYGQFYLADKNSSKMTGSVEFWTEETNKSRLAVGDGIIGIGIENQEKFNGEITLLQTAKSAFEYDSYDHIVEGALNINSGILQALDCPNFNVELELNIAPGNYKVRIYAINIDFANVESDNDYYKIELWPDISHNTKVLKQYHKK